jgi:hypothetical protein
MKHTPLVVAALVAAAVLSPSIAYAEEPPPPATYDEPLPGVLDCDRLTWTFTTVHYRADWVGPNPTDYTDWYEGGRSDVVTGATVAECPDWVEVAGDVYTYTRDGGTVWEPPVADVPATVLRDDGIVWKVGLVV